MDLTYRGKKKELTGNLSAQSGDLRRRAETGPVVSTQGVGNAAKTISGGIGQTIRQSPQITPIGGGATIQPVKRTMSTNRYNTQVADQPGMSQETKNNLQTQYTPSQGVQDAYKRLQEIIAGKPGAYSSQWQDTINELYGQLTNRKPFEYDAASDPLYLQYRALYTQQGKNAMMNTMGQAAGLTGGYGSSYSQNVGQQAYDAYLQQLNEVVPQLANQAYQKYRDEGNDLMTFYNLARENESQDYSRWRDTMGDWQNERSYARGEYDTEYDRDYGAYEDFMARALQLAQMEGSNYQWQQQFDYQKERDRIADEQWERQFAASQAARSYGGGGGSGGGGSGRSSSGSTKKSTGKNTTPKVRVEGEGEVSASDAQRMINSGRYVVIGYRDGRPILGRSSNYRKPGKNINLTK